MIINTNVPSINSQRNFAASNNALSKSLEKLSSGYRINRAADDAAGLAISEKMRSQYRGLNQAVSNAKTGITLIQTAEGALNESHSILQRMRELAVQAATDTNTSADRQKIQAEVDQLSSELSRISNTTEYNTMNLLGGNFGLTGNKLYFHIGANKDQNMGVGIGAMDAYTLGVAGVGTKLNGAGTSNISNVRASTASLNNATINVTATSTVASTANNTVTFSTVDRKDDTLNSNAATAASVNIGGANVTSQSGTLEVKITNAASDGTSVTEVQYRFGDGTWQLATLSGTAGATSEFKLGDSGLTVTFTNGGSSGSYAAGDVASFAKVKGAELEFAVNGWTNVSAKVSSNDTIVLNGGSSGTLTFNLADIDTLLKTTFATATDTASWTVVATASSEATFNGDGTVKTNAVAAAGAYMGTQAAANDAIAIIDKAINSVSDQRSTLGAYQNRLEHTINNLQVASENLQSAESTIRNTDMAAEMSNFVKYQILSQAGVSMLAQANMMPQTVLSLLG